MIMINLDTIDKCRDLCELCDKYPHMSIDICHGRYIVDASSFLGVLSLLNNRVDIVAHYDNQEDANKFEKDVEKIGGFYEN